MDQPGDAPRPTVVVVAGGPVGDVASPVVLPAGAVVIAADSGVDRARALGWPIHRVVGDLDSVTAEGLAAARDAGARVDEHEPDKDATDLELALDVAIALDPAEILVVGGTAGRLDLLLADLLLLAGPKLAGVEVTARFGAAVVTVVRPGRPRTITGPPGTYVSLLPVHGRAAGVTTEGLRWALTDAVLVAGTTRGASNELVGHAATVSCAEGVLAVVQAGLVAPPIADRTGAYDPSPGCSSAISSPPPGLAATVHPEPGPSHRPATTPPERPVPRPAPAAGLTEDADPSPGRPPAGAPTDRSPPPSWSSRGPVGATPDHPHPEEHR